MSVTPGVGYLIANDLLMDASYIMLQPCVNEVLPYAVTPGPLTISVYDPAMYVGAQLVIGSARSGNLEVITITVVTVGVSFTAVFGASHNAGEPIRGATFPVRQPTDPLFTQAEMLEYLSTAFNDYLIDSPLVYAVADTAIPANTQSGPLAADSMFPVRAALTSYPLRETSQSNLDSVHYKWTESAPSTPRVYFRDKLPTQTIGVWPTPSSAISLEVVYAQRQATLLGLADGFLLPDPYCLYPLCKALSFAFSKDGDGRNPALARYFETRYLFGVKLSKMLLDVVNDPNPDIGT
jgi:hypothetical protein